MPTYQYACTQCGDELEVFQSFSDPSLTVHEDGCGGPLRKVFGSVGVVFKGSGFYRTDSRKGPVEPGATKSDAKSETKSETKTDSAPAKSDSAPATKSESAPAKKSETKSSGSTAAA